MLWIHFKWVMLMCFSNSMMMQMMWFADFLHAPSWKDEAIRYISSAEILSQACWTTWLMPVNAWARR